MAKPTPSDSERSSEFAKISDALARPAIRKMFALDPISALERAGVDVSKVPETTVDLLASLAPWELDVLGRVAELAKSKGLQAKSGDHVGVIIH